MLIGNRLANCGVYLNVRIILKRIAVGIIALSSLTIVCLACLSYTASRFELARAKEMMNDAAHLKVGASMSEVLAFARKHNGTSSGKWAKDPCTPSDCLVVATVASNEWAEKHPKVYKAYSYIIRRGWSYSILMWVENGVLVAQRQYYHYSTPTVSNAVIVQISPAYSRLCGFPSYQLHKAFTVDMGPKHFNIWAHSSNKELSRVSEVNLTCVNTIRGCTTLAEMAPEAWRVYERDRPTLQTTSAWSSEQVSACIESFGANSWR